MRQLEVAGTSVCRCSHGKKVGRCTCDGVRGLCETLEKLAALGRAIITCLLIALPS